MPNRQKHHAHTKKRYGVRGEDLHAWIDEPHLLCGSSHRKYRHHPDMEIPKIFIDRYGEELARNILLDHIYCDKKDEITREKLSPQPFKDRYYFERAWDAYHEASSVTCGDNNEIVIYYDLEHPLKIGLSPTSHIISFDGGLYLPDFNQWLFTEAQQNRWWRDQLVKTDISWIDFFRGKPIVYDSLREPMIQGSLSSTSRGTPT